MEEERTTLEDDFDRLEEITGQMEEGELSLEELFTLYKEGVELLKSANDKIDTVEKNMLLIDSDGVLREEEL